MVQKANTGLVALIVLIRARDAQTAPDRQHRIILTLVDALSDLVLFFLLYFFLVAFIVSNRFNH